MRRINGLDRSGTESCGTTARLTVRAGGRSSDARSPAAATARSADDGRRDGHAPRAGAGRHANRGNDPQAGGGREAVDRAPSLEDGAGPQEPDARHDLGCDAAGTETSPNRLDRQDREGGRTDRDQHVRPDPAGCSCRSRSIADDRAQDRRHDQPEREYRAAGSRRTSRQSSAAGNRLTIRSGDRVDQLDPDPLVDPALGLVAGDLDPPDFGVFATCVPPSACRSRPTISIVRISSIPGGSRLILVRIRSGMANASLARQHRDPDVSRGRARH